MTKSEFIQRYVIATAPSEISESQALSDAEYAATIIEERGYLFDGYSEFERICETIDELRGVLADIRNVVATNSPQTHE